MPPLVLKRPNGATSDGAITWKMTIIPQPSEGTLDYTSSHLNSLNTAKIRIVLTDLSYL